MKYEFKTLAELRDFMSEHPKEFEEDDEIVVAQPLFKGDAAETKLRVACNYEKKKETKRKKNGNVTFEWLTPEKGE